VLHHYGHDHFCFGHVSALSDRRDVVIIKAAGVGLGGVEERHVAIVDMDGRNLTPELQLHDETALHLAVYRHRPDVGAVVHTHPLSAQAATLLDPTPDLVCSQDGMPFVGSLATYDTPELVRDAQRGDQFASCLGSARGALMRAHGLVTVGRDIAEATALALLLERCLSVFLLASSAGPIRPITERSELAAAFEATHHSRMNAIWKEALRACGLA